MNRNSTLSQSNSIQQLARKVKKASYSLAHSSLQQRNKALLCAAEALRASMNAILSVNSEEVEKTEVGEAFKDRMTLNENRLEAMAHGLEAIATLPDPLGKEQACWTRPNGLEIRRVTVPLGVIGMIYESRPNVGADAAGICIKSGNGVILRGGSECYQTAILIHQAMQKGVQEAGLDPDIIAMAPDNNRQHVKDMLQAVGLIDVLIPRGGRSLVEYIQKEARIPVLAHAAGLCHTYIHGLADFEKARAVLINAKMRRTGICGATETLLIDQAVARQYLPKLADDLIELGCRLVGDTMAVKIDSTAIVSPTRRHPSSIIELGCRLVGDTMAVKIDSRIGVAKENDFATEWLDSVLSVKVVKNIYQAIQHILKYGSGHTEAILTEDKEVARYFMDHVESAVVMWNASTQFCDGGEFGFGAEIGIATGRLHARGPVGVEQLTSYRYEVIGNGQVRPV